MGRDRFRGLLLVPLVLAAAAIAITACSSGPGGQSGGSAEDPPKTTPSIRGVITRVDGSGDGRTALIVWTDDPAIGVQAEYDAASVRITSTTGAWERTGSSIAKVSPDDISVGDIVEAWFAGAVAESYPVQTTADDVLITGDWTRTPPTPKGLQPPQ